MRKITLTIICVLFAIEALAQAPQGISHQAVIRNAANELIINSPVGIKVSILSGSIIYSETHTPISNANGLISFVIGQGVVLSGVFSEINWAGGPYFLKTEADPTGGTNYTIEGISQILSVPYALFAGKSGDQTWNKNLNDIYYQNGNVGIGTDSPGAGLHLKGWAFPSSFMFLESGAGQDAGFRIYEGDDVKWHIYNQAGTGGLIIFNAAWHPALFVKQANGNVGIGTTEPTALLHTQGTGQGEGNVLFTGFRKESGWGDPPVNGPGTRMMWYPDKAAFRVGEVWNDNWHRDSIGNVSIGMGFGSKAWGSVSTALGLETSAGHYSTAMGWATKALGNSSTAMGRESIASGDNSTAMGWSTTASGDLSTAMGYQTIASGKFSTAMGLGTKALSGYETVIGRWNAEYTPHDSLGWNDNDRLFVVGSGSSSTNRANAMTVLKNGNVGIGFTEPEQKLHIDGNVLIPPGKSYWIGNVGDFGNRLRLHLGGSNAYIDWGEENLTFRSGVSNSTPRVVFTGAGNVGIGTSVPTQLLDINGQLRIRGGNPGVGKVLTSDANGTATWQPAAPAISKLSCVDIDGNAYPTIVIGTQIWMAENLRVTKYRNGNTIPNVTSAATWGALTTGAYCWYGNDATANAKYGALYNWHAVNDPRGLCPEGWRVPTDAEWTIFTNWLGGGNVAGGKLKAVSPLWDNPNTDATNSSGFSSLPGGNRNANGTFYYIGIYGFWWGSTEHSSTHAWGRHMGYGGGGVSRGTDDKASGFSVRCLRDID